MQRTIIVTDLTRFIRPDIVCTAGMDRGNGQCIRPRPYLKIVDCRRLNILPGTILSGNFVPFQNRDGPHQEDHNYTSRKFKGQCSSMEFKAALMCGLFESVEAGFEFDFRGEQKHIPFGHDVKRSIITIRTPPESVEIFKDPFSPGKIKLDFMDQSGHKFRTIGITDLGLHNHAMKQLANNQLHALNRWIHSQEEVLLRLGLGRRYQAPDGRDGYWLQANGIYTFPDCRKAIRSYS